MTEYEKIIKMPPEELADFLESCIEGGICYVICNECKSDNPPDCIYTILQWLKSK